MDWVEVADTGHDTLENFQRGQGSDFRGLILAFTQTYITDRRAIFLPSVTSQMPVSHPSSQDPRLTVAQRN